MGIKPPIQHNIQRNPDAMSVKRSWRTNDNGSPLLLTAADILKTQNLLKLEMPNMASSLPTNALQLKLTPFSVSSHIQYLWQASSLCSLVDNTLILGSSEMIYSRVLLYDGVMFSNIWL